MSNIYVIIESYIDIGGTTTYTYLGYVAMESEAYKYVQYAIGRIFAMPLSERLTAEEKERVRKVYRRNCAEIAKYDNDVITAHSEGVMHALELFFGTDFFKEDE